MLPILNHQHGISPPFPRAHAHNKNKVMQHLELISKADTHHTKIGSKTLQTVHLHQR